MTKPNIDQRLKEIRAQNVRIYCKEDPAIYTTLNVASDGALTMTTTGGTDSDVIIDASSGSGDLLMTDTAIKWTAGRTGKAIETGTYQSAVDGGITLSDTNTRPVSFLFDDSGSALTGNNRAVLSRVYLASAQGSGGTIVAMQGQLKIADNKNFSAGRFCGVDGYMEFAGTTTIASGSYVSAMNARVDVAASETVTVSSGGFLCGIHVHTTGTGTLTSTGNSYGIYINDQGTVDDWKVGIGIANATTGIDVGAATTGINVSGATTTGLALSGTATSGINVSGICTTAINVSVAQTDETGLGASAVFQHGSYNTALAYGTQTNYLVMKCMNITAAATSTYVFGDINRITTSAASVTGYIHVGYNYLSIGHDLVNGYASRGRVEITAGCAVGETTAVLGTCNIANSVAVTATGTAVVSAGIFDLAIGTSAALAQEGTCIEVRPRIRTNVVGVTSGIRINIPCATPNYVDYGLDIRSMSAQQTAAIRIHATPNADALTNGIWIEGQDTSNSTITNAIRLVGTVTNCLYFAEADGSQGAHSSDSITANAGASTGSFRISIAGVAYYVPIYAAGTQGAGW